MNDEQTTKAKILDASKELFVTKGFKATTIREIANKAKMNSALIQYHFKGKQGLLLAITSELYEGELEYFSEILDADLDGIDEMKIKLSFFLDMLILHGLSKWQSLKIVVNESYELSKIKSFKFNNHAELCLKTLENFFLKAKKKAFLSKEINTKILSDNLISLAVDQVLNWKANIQHRGEDISDKAYRKIWLSQTLTVFLHGVLNRNS